MKQIVPLLCLVILPIAFALRISDVSFETKENIAIIKWVTDKESDSKVNYGTTPELGLSSYNGKFVKEHEIILDELKPATTYYFSLESSDGTETVIDDNQGELYTFTTFQDREPEIKIELPPYYKKSSININGFTDSKSRIILKVNNGLIDWRESRADILGKFSFSDVNLQEGKNTITITAIDPGNKKTTKDYEIIVDTKAPRLVIEDIPELLTTKKLTIKGKVDEESKINIYVLPKVVKPPKIEKINLIEVTDTSVTFEWKPVRGHKYAIYRNGIRVAITSEPTFSEILNPSSEYTYEVSVINKACYESEKTRLVVKTKPGGRIMPIILEEVPLVCEPDRVIDSSKTANQIEADLTLDQDGAYTIKVEAIDKAGNKAIIEKTTYLDVSKPELEKLIPEPNTFIYENFADDITIKGKTEPYATIYLYLMRTPFGRIGEAPEKIEELLKDVEEADLRPDCDCNSGADYMVKADKDGYFKIEDVDLTSMFWVGLSFQKKIFLKNVFNLTRMFSVGLSMTQVPYQQLVKKELIDEAERQDAYLVFVIIDRAKHITIKYIKYEIGSCWSGNFIWDVTPLTELQSPTFLSPERLMYGVETLYFFLNFSYHGAGKNAYITNVEVREACDELIENNPKYNHSCKVIPESCSTELLNPHLAYVVCRLSSYKDMSYWMSNDWKSFFKAISNEMIFPFKVTIEFRHKIKGKEVYGIQSFCQPVSYVVDAALIDPRKVLPHFLLYDGVDTLNKTIDALDKTTSVVDKLLKVSAIACGVSFLTKLGVQVYRRIVCYYDKLPRDSNNVGNDGCSCDSDQNKLSDECLEACYPNCARAWKLEATVYKAFRYSCDRIFGHKTPSRWTESLSDEKLYQKLRSGKGCANDLSVLGQPIRAEKCSELNKRLDNMYNNFVGLQNEYIKSNKKCFGVRVPSKKYIYAYSDPKQVYGNLYELSLCEKRERNSNKDIPPKIYAIKQTTDSYLTSRPETCAKICNGNSLENGWQTTPGKYWNCTTVDKCLSLNYQHDDSGKYRIKADPKGYTSNCFYNSTNKDLNTYDVISDDPTKRRECCCIEVFEGDIPEKYYQPSDFSDGDSENGYQEIPWSYRYAKIKFKDKVYNPHRYIAGRDHPACFGQNNWLYDAKTPKGKIGNLLIIDPAKQFSSTFQCVYITGIYHRLVSLRNMLNALKSCLLTVRKTGRADSGVCKELFAQYVCSFIWKAITWLRDGCLPFGIGWDTEYKVGSWEEALKVGMNAVWDTLAEAQQELESEYGNVKFTTLLGAEGEEAIARKICLAAFGYDWEFSFNRFMETAYSAPVSSLVQAVLPGREFLTFDPVTYQGTYEYRASWLINPGCRLAGYQVYLSCVNRAEMKKYPGTNCIKVKDPQGINCDCLDLPNSQEHLFYLGRSLDKNEFEDISHRDIITSDYRYDHLKFVLIPSREILEHGDPELCFPEGHTDERGYGIFYFPITDYTARDLTACYVDIGPGNTGMFRCTKAASLLYDRGIAYITSIDLNDDNKPDLEGVTLSPNQPNQPISATVRVEKDEFDQCWVAYLLDPESYEEVTPRYSGKVSDEHLKRGHIVFQTGNILVRPNVKVKDSSNKITGDDKEGQKNEGNEKNQKPKWLFHIDLRHPKKPNGDCEEIKSPQYDETNIIFANGRLQSYEIPIYLMPKKEVNQ